MQVKKRNGCIEEVSFDKVIHRIKAQCLLHPICSSVDYILIAQKVCARIYDGVSTTELDELAANTCISLSTEEPEYGIVATRIIISNNHKQTPSTFSEAMSILYNQPNPVVSQQLYEICQQFSSEIESRIDYMRDYDIDFFGFKTLEKSYLKTTSVGGTVVERPQHMWMRVALGIHCSNLNAAFETYDAMSLKKLTHATPTLFHSGTPRNQFLSCFLLGMDDSIAGIYKCLADCAQISKWAGGIGFNVSNIRSKGSLIRGTNGHSEGIIPMLKVFNDTAVYVNQCFHPDTIVYTNNGPKMIKNISVSGGDNVVTIDGSYKPVRNVICNQVSKELLIIKTQHALYPTKCTPEHQIFAISTPDPALSAHTLLKNKIQPRFIDAKDLNVGDLVFIPQGLFSNTTEKSSKSQVRLRFEGIIDSIGSIRGGKFVIPLKKTQQFQPTRDFIIAYLNENKAQYELKTRIHVKQDWVCLTVSEPILRPNYNVCRMSRDDTITYLKGVIEPMKKNTRHINIKSSDYIRICLFRFLFMRVGYLTRGYRKNEKKTTKFVLNIPLWNEFCSEFTEISTTTDAIEFARDDILNGSWTRIKTIRRQAYTGPVYDLSIDENHNYLTDMGLVHNSGKRNGSFAIYIEPWHPDICDFLELKKNHGDEAMRCRDLFYALWVPDLFMERVERGEQWSLMDPDRCPGLIESHGAKFNTLYLKYEAEGRIKKTIPARDLFNRIIESQIETGTPYIGYKDAVNAKTNQMNLGTIRNSNLCIEIAEYSDSTEYACCTLGSLGLPAFISTDGGVFQFDELAKCVKILVRNLNIIIDSNFYPVPETKRSNERHRPIGIGIQGLADVYIRMRLPFDSPEAAQLNREIFATIYYAALEESVDESIRSGETGIGYANIYDKEVRIRRIALGQSWVGAYSSFEGSPISQGRFQFDLWNTAPLNLPRFQWESLREKIMKYGIRNSLLVAPMPTASTSQILGNTECFEPITSNIYVRRVLAGEFIVVNQHLVRDLKGLGLWSKKIKDMIIQNNGSIQSIAEIPLEIRSLYKTVWEISMKAVIDQAADRGIYICQTQSLNLFIEKPDFNKITSMHFYAWKRGLKTGIYYLRTQAAAKAQQITIAPVEIPQSCNRNDPNCLACSS
jgi:ribonucleoside-diphosphate reductase alpha chain